MVETIEATPTGSRKGNQADLITALVALWLRARV
jgi:hypothetical protein